MKSVELLVALFDPSTFDPSTVLTLGLIFILIIIAIGLTLDEFRA